MEGSVLNLTMLLFLLPLEVKSRDCNHRIVVSKDLPLFSHKTNRRGATTRAPGPIPKSGSGHIKKIRIRHIFQQIPTPWHIYT